MRNVCLPLFQHSSTLHVLASRSSWVCHMGKSPCIMYTRQCSNLISVANQTSVRSTTLSIWPRRNTRPCLRHSIQLCLVETTCLHCSRPSQQIIPVLCSISSNSQLDPMSEFHIMFRIYRATDMKSAAYWHVAQSMMLRLHIMHSTWQYQF
jgi:hypothetical protein